MSDVNTAAAPADAGAPAPIPAGGLSVQDAVERYEKRTQQQPATERPRAPGGQFAPQSAPPERDAGPDDSQPPGETEADGPADEPPVEPPRSWAKEDKEAFEALPREVQERIAERERSREQTIRRSQDEIAEAKRAADAERQAVLAARQQYEQALPALLQSLYAQQAGEFADVRTHDDVRRMADEDWPRYVKWDAWQKQVSAVQTQLAHTNQQRQAQYQQWLANYQSEQDAKFLEKAPEFKDSKKGPSLQAEVRNYLNDVGYTDKEIKQAYETNPHFRDHRMQLMIRDAASKWASREALKSAEKKPVPPVQRPGTARAQNSGAAELQAAQDKFNKAPTLANATALRLAKQAAGKTS